MSTEMIKILYCLFITLLFNITAYSEEATSSPRSEEEQQIITIYKNTNRSVVNIITKVLQEDFFGTSIGEGSGSGILIDKTSGLIVTNFHVIEGASEIICNFANGDSDKAKVIGIDPDNDLALIKVENLNSDLPSAKLGTSSNLEIGQRVIAIGNPFGLERTLTTGIVSSLNRSIKAGSGRIIQDIIQTDAAINPGNSGGPLLDKSGRVIAINTAIISNSGQSAGIGFAIPIDQVIKVIPQLLKYGKVLRPKIDGLNLADTDFGPVVMEVYPNSDADRAGLVPAKKLIKKGRFVGYIVDYRDAHFIIKIGDKNIKSKSEAINEIEKSIPEDQLNGEIQITVQNGPRGKTDVVKVVVRKE